MAIRNIGQVASIFVGTSPPTNHTLIWFDNTSGVMKHKIWDEGAQIWTILDSKLISYVTYSELVASAQVGLTIGAIYCITDRNDAIATVIGNTTVNYIDGNKNHVIDDLTGSNSYIVPSTNLSIDGITGTLDASTFKLNFNMPEQQPDYVLDYVLAKVYRSSNWQLGRFKLTSLLSTTTGNSISWTNGFYFNFTTAVANIMNVAGGVTGYDLFLSNSTTVRQDITNIQTSINNILSQMAEIIGNLLDIPLPDDWTPADYTGTIDDVKPGDTVSSVLSAYQGKFSQIGNITNGNIKSKENTNQSVPRTEIDLKNGKIKFSPDKETSGYYTAGQYSMEVREKPVGTTFDQKGGIYMDWKYSSDDPTQLVINPENIVMYHDTGLLEYYTEIKPGKLTISNMISTTFDNGELTTYSITADEVRVR